MGHSVRDANVPRVLERVAARRLGYSDQQIDRRLRAGRWRRVLPRTYFTGDVLTWRDRLDAALAFGGTGARLSGAAALTVDDITCVRPPSTVLVLVPPGKRLESTDWVKVRATRRYPGQELGPGPARAAIQRSAADHALTCRRIDDVRALVSELVRNGHCTVDDLTRELATGPRNASALLRRALADVAGGAASAPEARAGAILRRSRVPAFEQNARIDYPGGYYVADFLWRSLRAILEIDSVEYHLDPVAWRATMARDLRLETLGYSVVHVPPSALHNEPEFVRVITAWLMNRAATHPLINSA